MKKIIIPALFAAFTFASTAISAQTLPPGWPFPEKNERTKEREKEDRRRDRDERVARDRDGNVITRDGRVERNDRNLPPGQAKKKYGGQSAKVYAPGQRKKTDRNDDIVRSRRDRDDDRRNTDIFGTRRDRDDDDDDDRKQKKQKKNKNKGRR
jgi:hypothetical protein